MNLPNPFNSDYANLGSVIRQRRLELGLSLADLANGKFSTNYLNQVENNQIQPSIQNLESIASRLVCTLSDLLALTNPPNPGVSLDVRYQQELAILNAHVALQSKQPQNALNYLEKIKVNEIPIDLLPRFYATCGEANVQLNQYEEAFTNLNKALEMYEADPDSNPLHREQVRNWIGLAYYGKNKPYLAIQTHKRCLVSIIEDKISASYFKMLVLRNLGNEYHLVGNHYEALDFYRQALELAVPGEQDMDLAAIYWGMGLCYRSLEDLDRAKIFLARSSSIYKDLEQLEYYCALQCLVGLIMVSRGEYQQAESVLIDALHLAQELNYNVGFYTANVNLAYLFKVKGDLVLALQFSKDAVEKSKLLNNNLNLGQALAEQADIEIASGTQEGVEKGLAIFEEALSVLEATESSEYLGEFYFHYAVVLEGLGRLSEAAALYRTAFNHKKQL